MTSDGKVLGSPSLHNILVEEREAAAARRLSSYFTLPVSSLQPYPRQARPLPPRAHGHRDAWRDSPWEHQHQRARGRMHLVREWGEQLGSTGWAELLGLSSKFGLAKGWDSPGKRRVGRSSVGRGTQSTTKIPTEACWMRGCSRCAAVLTCGNLLWQPSPRQPRPYGGPADIHRNKENGRWAPQDCDVPPPRLYREDHRSREVMFFKDLQPERRGGLGRDGGVMRVADRVMFLCCAVSGGR